MQPIPSYDEVQQMDIYHPDMWKHCYSFVGYFIIAIVLRWVMGQLIKKTKQQPGTN
ncbi:hypothetical protein [Sporomusa aerivorans]|uniref:hypothetical protein n=1 Tax=Sporomusa aerivorans TaxID=204936 RepID=UPI00352A7549